MVTKWVLDAVTAFATWVVGILPAPSVPSWLAAAPTQIRSVMGQVSGFGTWLPVTLMGDALAFVLLCLVAAGSVKLIRIVASFLTAGGGSAA